MNITWTPDRSIVKTPFIRSPIYMGISDNFTAHIAVDFNNEDGCITCNFPTCLIFIPFKFSQIPGEQNDPDLLVLAHQLIEKQIQTLTDNGQILY